MVCLIFFLQMLSGIGIGLTGQAVYGQAIQEIIGEDIDRRKITLLEEVKNLGDYTAKVQLHEEVEFNINFEVYAD